MNLFSDGGAEFSPSLSYRYHLWRKVGGARGRCCFVMLNPSTADETANDPTIRRCIGFARCWGYAHLDVLNIFAWRSTDPRALYDLDNPIGPSNDATIARVAAAADVVICAWGKHGALHGRGEAVRKMLGARAKALHINGDGSPKHPLYLRAELLPIAFGGSP